MKPQSDTPDWREPIIRVIEHAADGWDKQGDVVIANALRALIPEMHELAAPVSERGRSVTIERESLPALRERFERWFKMTYPLFREGAGRDTTIKHQLWTAWQVAHLSPSPYERNST